MILVDAHVHLYDGFNLEAFFSAAYRNFEKEAKRSGHGDDFSGVLLLAETARENWFHQLSAFAAGEMLPGGRETGGWDFFRTDESCSLLGRSDDRGALFVVAGRQIVTLEGLEVLSLANTNLIQDGAPLDETVSEVRNAGGIPVIPWGFGKWTGRRGAVLEGLMKAARAGDFFLGDSANRPSFLPPPPQWKLASEKNLRNLPGSDPLPFPSEQGKPGRFGFSVSDRLDESQPSSHLKSMMRESSVELKPYGEPVGFTGFVTSQVRLQLRGIVGKMNRETSIE
jgi:hypothetical protein